MSFQPFAKRIEPTAEERARIAEILGETEPDTDNARIKFERLETVLKELGLNAEQREQALSAAWEDVKSAK